VYQAAHVLGGDAFGMFALNELEDMSQRPLLELNGVRRVGADLRLSYRVLPA
jgi:riboflavin biosynthesis pyrimidine reductase